MSSPQAQPEVRQRHGIRELRGSGARQAHMYNRISNQHCRAGAVRFRGAPQTKQQAMKLTVTITESALILAALHEKGMRIERDTTGRVQISEETEKTDTA